MDVPTLEAEIIVTKAILAAIGAAFLAIADSTISSYSLDDGQTTQRASRENIPALLEQRRLLMNELCMMQARLTGGNVSHSTPAW